MSTVNFNALIKVLLFFMFSFAAVAELPYNVQRRLDKVSDKLVQVEKLHKTNFRQAQVTMDEASKELNYIYEYYGGKFDENNTAFQQVVSRLKDLELMMNQPNSLNETNQSEVNPLTNAHKDVAGSELHDLKQLLLIHEKSYLPQYKQLQNKMLGLSSHLQTNNYELINNSIIELSNELSQFNAVYYPLAEFLSKVNEKYPDQQTLMAQGQIGADVSMLIRVLNSKIKAWEQQRDKKISCWLEEARSSVSQTELVMAQVKQMPADAREPMVNQFVALLTTPKNLVSIIPAFYKPSKDVGSINQTYITQAENLKKDLVAIEQNILKISESARKEIEKQIQANRFPENLNEDHSDKGLIIRAYQKAYKADEILRFGVSKDWYEKTEAHWENDTLLVNTYQYIHAWIAHKTESGSIRAYNLSFRKTLKSDGNWSQLSYWGVGNSFEILSHSINL